VAGRFRVRRAPGAGPAGILPAFCLALVVTFASIAPAGRTDLVRDRCLSHVSRPSRPRGALQPFLSICGQNIVADLHYFFLLYCPVSIHFASIAPAGRTLPGLGVCGS